MRWKYERENLPAYRCCFCCHVRTGTLILGLLYLVFDIFLLSAVTMLVFRPELIYSILCTNDTNESTSSALVNATTTAIKSNPLLFSLKDQNLDDLVAGIILICGLTFVTCCLIYGTIMGLPRFITPFFCVQVFDMCISGMAMLSYFSSTQELKRWIAAQTCFPKKQLLLSLDDNNLMALTLIMFVTVLFFKMYFVGVVWACYKYLQQYAVRLHGQTSLRHYSTDVMNTTDDTEMLLPPKYEDVVAMRSDEPLPPAYSEH